MKKCMCVTLFLSIMAITACMKEEYPTSAPMCIQDSGMVTFEVSVSETNTKVTSTVGESQITSVQIYVFDAAEGIIETYYKGITAAMNISCTTGDKEIVALVNSVEISDIADKADLMSRVTNLSDNSTSAFVMLGSKVESITVNHPNVFINVSRLVARVSIGKIKKEFTVPLYQDGVTSIRRIFLINVVGDMTFQAAGNGIDDYEPTIWYNQSEFKSDLPDLLSEEVDEVVRGEYDVPHYFYCYPNPNTEENATRLVIEAVINRKNFFYSITIPGIKSNHSYHISELTLTRLGTLTPDKCVEIEPVRFQIEVSDWENGIKDLEVEI